MTPRLSLIGQLAQSAVLAKTRVRVAVFVVLIAIAATLAFFPERHRAAATLTPTDPQTLGLSETLGQLGALNSVFGKQADVEVALRIGSSIYMRETVMKKLNLAERIDMHDKVELHRWLEDRIRIRSLRGGIIQIEFVSRDKELAYDIVNAVAEATRDRLAEINIRQTSYKREILQKLVDDSAVRLSKAESAFNSYRLENGYADPGTALASISSRGPLLQGALNELEAALAAARQVYAEEHLTVVQLRAERDALKAQLQEALDTEPKPGRQNVGEAVAVSTKLYELERELNLARSLYDSYKRYLEGTSVEDLTSSANIRMLEEPYIDTERQIWWPALGAAITLFLLWMAIEFYRLRPPVGARLEDSDDAPAKIA